MNEVLVFPDAVEVAKAIIGDFYADVYARVPAQRPAEFIRLRRTGGTRANLVVDAATVVVEAWAADEHRAMELAQLARGWLHAAAGTTTDTTPIYRVLEFSGPAVLPDPESDQARVTQTLQLHLRGTAA